MSAGQDPNGDLVAVACVVDASLLLASEWSRILTEYVLPLLKRLNELHPTHQFRIAFVTYGSADSRPSPLLTRRYFAPLALVTKELREDPSRLGIGEINSGSNKGLSALEGFVAAIEFFDILMASANFNVNHAPTQSPQKDNRSLISHLLHIAASPPDSAQRPQHNTLQHLDFVNWECIPTELRKRKINLSLITLRKIPQFQDLQSSVAGPSAQSPWFNVHAPHVLSLAGFPTPQKTSEHTYNFPWQLLTGPKGTKRLPDALLSDQSPDSKRQKVIADPVPKTASPALPPVRIPQNPRSQQPVAPQVTQPPSTTVPNQNSSSAQPVQTTASIPVSTPATASPSAPPPPPPPPLRPSLPIFNAEVLSQTVASTTFTFGQMLEYLKGLEKDIPELDLKIVNAQNSGQATVLAQLRKDRAAKAHIRDQIKILLKQHYYKLLLAKENSSAHTGAAGPALPAASSEAGSSIQAQPQNVTRASSERPAGLTIDEHKIAVPDSQVLAQFWQSRGGTVSVPNGGNPQAGPSQTQPHPRMTPELATQMQKLIEKKGIRPPSFGPSPVQIPGTMSHETGANPNPTNNQFIQPHDANSWSGTFVGTFPKLSGQVTNELQIHVAGIFTTPMPTEIRAEIRTDLWPRSFALNPCKEPVKDNEVLLSWLKRHQPRCRVMQFKPDSHAPDASMNEQRYQAFYKFMNDYHVFAFAGWQLPSGKFSYNIFIFPIGGTFAGAVFPDGLPDLPGSGNGLNVNAQIPVGEAKLPLLSGMTLPPWLIARMQGLEPPKQKLLLAQFFRAQQQEDLRRQQIQQSQQVQTASGQALNPIGMSIPPNPYGAMGNIPAGLHPNVNTPTNTGAYNARGGTVNYEMMQSFMQRNADGSTSQGMNPASMP